MASRLQLMPLLSNFAKHAQDVLGAVHRPDEVCSSSPVPAPAHVKIGPAYTTGCGGETMYSLPVEPEYAHELEDLFEYSAPAVVCVVDDMAYMFPKYGGEDFGPSLEDDE